MDEFAELEGRIEGLGRAFLLLAETMERETDMDGLTLTRRMREAAPDGRRNTGMSAAARRTLEQLADWLDDARSQRQEQARLYRMQAAQPAPPAPGGDPHAGG